MLAFTLLAAIAALAPALAQDACSAAPYTSLLCLPANETAAASACSGLPLQTVTSTTTTTTLSLATLSTSQDAPSQVTVTATNTQVDTVYVTAGSTTTVTSIYTDIQTFNTTITTYVPTLTTCTDEQSATPFAFAAPAACNTNDALSALQSFTGHSLVTGCSCAGHPASTTTTTLVVTASPVPATTTLVAGSPATTTVNAITLLTATLTVAPTTTMHLTTCTSTTSTETISYAAPTYTYAFGPRAGCIDMAAGPGKALSANVKDHRDAMLECMKFCTQEPSCSFLYVQHLLVDYGSAQPFFQCFAHDEHFAEADLECGALENIYGSAEGFNALHRGTKPL